MKKEKLNQILMRHTSLAPGAMGYVKITKTEAIEAMVAAVHADRQSRWISTKERMPEYDYIANGEGFAFVIVWADMLGVPRETMYCNGLFYDPLLLSVTMEKTKRSNEPWAEQNNQQFHESVTHWQELPPPPKKS